MGQILLLTAGLFQDALQRASRYIDIGFARYRNSAAFRAMMELAMAAFLTHLEPSIALQQGDELPDFHDDSAVKARSPEFADMV